MEGRTLQQQTLGYDLMVQPASVAGKDDYPCLSLK
jgi:hypothetical protein